MDSMSIEAVLPNEDIYEPLRFLFGTAVRPPADHEARLNDEIEQYCALKQDEANERAKINDNSVELMHKSAELKGQIVTQLDKAVTILQLLTQTQWGNDRIKFLNLRPATAQKDPPHNIDVVPIVESLVAQVKASADNSFRAFQQSSNFATVLADLKTRWPLEESSNQVTVDLLPMKDVMKDTSPYIAKLFIDKGVVCVGVPALIAEDVKRNSRLQVHGVSEGLSDRLGRRSGSVGKSRQSATSSLEKVLQELQSISLDHAIFHELVAEAAADLSAVSRRVAAPLIAAKLMIPKKGKGSQYEAGTPDDIAALMQGEQKVGWRSKWAVTCPGALTDGRKILSFAKLDGGSVESVRVVALVYGPGKNLNADALQDAVLACGLKRSEGFLEAVLA